MKRKRNPILEEHDVISTPTPKQTRQRKAKGDNREDATATAAVEEETPSKRSRGQARQQKNIPLGFDNIEDSLAESATPKTKTRTIGKENRPCTTPQKSLDPPPAVAALALANADRSARRKSARSLIERTVAGDLSDDSGIAEDDELARQIWADEEGEGHEEDEDGEAAEDDEDGEDDKDVGNGRINLITEAEATPTDTPSKRGPGRPKGARRKRSPTPPTDLPPHEQYFFHNRPGKIKTSSNTLSSVSLLSHSDYHDRMSTHEDSHASSISFLHALHTRAFPQWMFELAESFSICLYGYGSKRGLVTSFARYIHSRPGGTSPPTTVIVNGFNPTCTPTQILNTIISTLMLPLQHPLPSQAPALLSHLLTHLMAHTPDQPIYLLLNSIDAPPLRKPATQALLASLASHPSIKLLATADQPYFPLLWDLALLTQYNFIFHDATTFVSYDDGKGTGEVGGVVDAVHELMGRKGVGRRGREGVGWVLRSLPENARGVFRILVSELLSLDSDDLDPGQDAFGDKDNDASDYDSADGLDAGDLPAKRKTKRRRGRTEETFGVEYKALYQKSVEEFLCSSEMAFRTLLKEFHDHQMIVSRRDDSGSEELGVPMRREDLEGVLEDLLG
ncbi:Origin recognition complex subunit 2 [Xylographa opegraphella]|nr:Origin recognition complex subunit 2 [Xylographa opegraphella]